MRLSEVCSSYFHGFHEISSISKNDAKTNALAILKIVSYITLVFPIIFGLLYVASSLYGRFNQNAPIQIAVDIESQKIISKDNPLVVRPYTGDLTNEEKNEIKTNLEGKKLKIEFSKDPSFDVSIRCQDLLESKARVIVNAANTHLGGGNGIDGLIHNKGGSEYRQAHAVLKIKYHSNYTEGFAEIITSGELKEKNIDHVIVVAGPHGEETPSKAKENALYSCYYNSLILADSKNLESIAFPSISTGIFAFPMKRASNIALKAIKDFIYSHPETTLKTISIHFLEKEKDKPQFFASALQPN